MTFLGAGEVSPTPVEAGDAPSRLYKFILKYNLFIKNSKILQKNVKFLLKFYNDLYNLGKKLKFNLSVHISSRCGNHNE